MNIRTNIFVLFLFYFGVERSTGSVISKWFHKESQMISCGTITPFSTADTLSDCAIECFEQNGCTVILFDGNADLPNRCKLVSSPFSAPVDLTGLLGHETFLIRPDSKVTCNIMGITTPEGWRSGCPKLYFPLDSDQSGLYGGSSTNANFSTDGILGKALYLKNDGSAPYAYHNLGNTFTSDQFCFPDPSSCMNGASFAFWLMIPQQPTGNSGKKSTFASILFFHVHFLQEVPNGTALNWN